MADGDKQAGKSTEMSMSPEVVETGSDPSSITIAPLIDTDLNRKRQQDREAIGYAMRSSIDERFFNGPLALPIKRHSKWQTWIFAYQTLGIVYGDLSTSVLYVYASISCDQTPDEDDYLGILSIIFWTLTLIGVFKYTFIVLYSDDHGEGGTFAMYSLLCQHTKVGGQAKRLSQFTAGTDSQLSHFHNREDRKTSKVREWLEHHKHGQKVLLFVVMLGTCMLIGDGVLTPAISVLSAIGGIQTEIPSITENVVVWVSAFILVLVFFAQSYGTDKVAFLFSPITALWLATNTMVGIYNIVEFYPTVFKAFSPHFIVRFFQRHKQEGWRMLGGIVLCITASRL